jgi:hypothetical protein
LVRSAGGQQSAPVKAIGIEDIVNLTSSIGPDGSWGFPADVFDSIQVFLSD